jgi:hypothetical protein
VAALALASALAGVVSGCAGEEDAGHAATPGTAVSVGAEHNGALVTLHRGEQLTVTLGSTYWELSLSPPSGVLSVISSNVSPGGPGCSGAVVGSGCGTVHLVLRAVGDGSAQVVGRRSSCGEALRCSPGQGTYELEVHVRG